MLTATEHHLKIRFVQLYQLVEACKGFACRVNKRKIKARYPGFLPSFDFSCVSNLEELFYFVEETRQDEVFTGEPAFWQPAIPHQYVGMPLYYAGCNEADFQPGKPYTDYPVLFDEIQKSPFDSLGIAHHFFEFHIIDHFHGDVFLRSALLPFYGFGLSYHFVGPDLLAEFQCDDNNGERMAYLRRVDNAIVVDQLRSPTELFEAMKMGVDIDNFGPLIYEYVTDFELAVHFLEEHGPQVLVHLKEELKNYKPLRMHAEMLFF